MLPLEILETHPERFFSFIQDKTFNNDNQLKEVKDTQKSRGEWSKKEFLNKRG